MRVRYFTETDTLWIELRPSPTVETSDIDDDTLEHALHRADLSTFDFERVTA